jgi:hypothetical protein
MGPALFRIGSTSSPAGGERFSELASSSLFQEDRQLEINPTPLDAVISYLVKDRQENPDSLLGICLDSPAAHHTAVEITKQ